MAKNKTTETENSVTDYLCAITNEQKRKDCTDIIEIMAKQTGYKPKMWGTGIIGFGSYHYKYESGHEGDMLLVGLAARANAITLYLPLNTDNRETLLPQFGKHKTSKGCIYIQKLADVDTQVLSEMVDVSIENMNKKYPFAKG